MAYAAGRLDVTIAAWERAHAQSVRAGDRARGRRRGGPGRPAPALRHRAHGPRARVDQTRAERLLEGQDETPVHAWLAVVRNYERLLSGDFQSARQWARRAIEVGARCAPAAAAIGRVAEARSLILEGEVRQGLGLLNEAAVATVSGELDPLSTGLVYCELVCALQALAQYDLAEEWTEAMERWRHGQPVGSIHGRCRVHRAEILRLRGALRRGGEGGPPGLRGAAALPAPGVRVAADRARPHPAAHGETSEGAEEAFRAAHEAGWDPQPGLALVHLAQGDVALAAASIRDALDAPAERPVEGAAAEHGAAPGAPARGAGRDRGRGRRPRPGPRGRRTSSSRIAARVREQGARCQRGARPGKGGAGRKATRRAPAVTSERPRSSGTRSARPTRRRSPGWGSGTRTAPRGTRSARLLEFRRRPVGLRAGRRRRSGDRSGPGVRRRGTRAMRQRAKTQPPVLAATDASRRRGERLSARGRLLVGGVRGADRPPAGPEGPALPRAPPRRSGAGVPRAGPGGRRDAAVAVDGEPRRRRPAWRSRRAWMPACCSTRRPRRRTAGGSPRSRRTSRRRGPWGTPSGPRRRTPSVTSSSASWPVRSGSAVAIGARGPPRNAREPA